MHAWFQALVLGSPGPAALPPTSCTPRVPRDAGEVAPDPLTGVPLARAVCIHALRTYSNRHTARPARSARLGRVLWLPRLSEFCLLLSLRVLFSFSGVVRFPPSPRVFFSCRRRSSASRPLGAPPAPSRTPRPADEFGHSGPSPEIARLHADYCSSLLFVLVRACTGSLGVVCFVLPVDHTSFYSRPASRYFPRPRRRLRAAPPLPESQSAL